MRVQVNVNGPFLGTDLKAINLKAGDLLDCPEWYARQLVADGVAVFPAPEEPEEQTPVDPEVPEVKSMTEPAVVVAPEGEPPPAFVDSLDFLIANQIAALKAAEYWTREDFLEADTAELLAVDFIGEATVEKITEAVLGDESEDETPEEDAS